MSALTSRPMQPVPPFGRCLSTADGGSLMKNSHHSLDWLLALLAAVLSLPIVGWTGPSPRTSATVPTDPGFRPEHRSDQSRRRRTSAVAIKPRSPISRRRRSCALGVDDTRFRSSRRLAETAEPRHAAGRRRRRQAQKRNANRRTLPAARKEPRRQDHARFEWVGRVSTVNIGNKGNGSSTSASRRHPGRSARSVRPFRPSSPSAMTSSIAHPSWRCHCH